MFPIDWYFALLRDTNTMRNEIDTAPRLADAIRGVNREIQFSDALLQKIRMPVKLVWGSADIYGGAETARRFAARFPNAELEIVDGTGHAPWVDQPDRAAAWVRQFLAVS